MQQEYKEAMEKISLSDSDKKRILANVKKACEESEEKVISMDEFKTVSYTHLTLPTN